MSNVEDMILVKCYVVSLVDACGILIRKYSHFIELFLLSFYSNALVCLLMQTFG